MNEIWTSFRGGVGLLTSKGKRVLYIYGLVLVVLASLDGVALFFVSRIFSTGANSSTSIEISSGGITLGVVIILFVLRTVLSTLMSWKVVRQFASEERQIGSHNYQALMSSSWLSRIDAPINDLYNAVDRGPTNLVQGLLVNVVTIAAEALTAALILLALLVLQPQTAIIATAYFLIVAVAQHRILSVSSARAGARVVEETNSVYSLLTDSFHLGKLLSVSDSVSLPEAVDQSRNSLALARGTVSFLGMLPRYFMELILALGLGVIAGITYLTSGTQGALSALTVFAAAGFRLLPIVNRIQGLILQLFSTLPAAKLALTPVTRVDQPRSHNLSEDSLLALRDVTFNYPSSDKEILSQVTLKILRGRQYAIVGPSGAGKTTLVDICLGLLEPTGGNIAIARDLRVAYVPQETYIAHTSLFENIALEWDLKHVDTIRAKRVSEEAQINDVLEGREGFGELSGTALSGGQKQRIGLARALYREPDLLFLDEVTSALDAETEKAVMKSIEDMRGRVTVVIVAHRLSTVQHADEVIYMDGGEILGIGTFDELRKTIPSFQRQIELGTLTLLD